MTTTIGLVLFALLPLIGMALSVIHLRSALHAQKLVQAEGINGALAFVTAREVRIAQFWCLMFGLVTVTLLAPLLPVPDAVGALIGRTAGIGLIVTMVLGRVIERFRIMRFLEYDIESATK